MIRGNGVRAGLLRWWRKRGDRASRNRRASRRFAALSRPAEVGWVDGESFVKASVSLRDVSLGGISALADVAPAVSSTVWVSLSDHHPGRWVKAVVVEVKQVRGLLTFRRTPYLIRMRFGLGCPYTFFRAAPWARPRIHPRGAPGRRRTADGRFPRWRVERSDVPCPPGVPAAGPPAPGRRSRDERLMKDVVRVILVDPCARSRQLLQRQLQAMRNVEVIEVCHAYQAAIKRIAALVPAVGDRGGRRRHRAGSVALVGTITLERHPAVTLVPAGEDDASTILRAMRAGAREYLPLPVSEIELAEVFRARLPAQERTPPRPGRLGRR